MILLNNCKSYIWHAFSALTCQQKFVAPKSKLKVLTANLGTLLDLYGVERGLDHFRSTKHLKFEDFIYYLHHEVFDSLPKTLSSYELKDYETKIAEVCWLICKKNYLPLDTECSKSKLTEESIYKLFRIFCTLSEETALNSEFKIHPSEVLWVVKSLMASLGVEYDENDWCELTEYEYSLKLQIFLTLIESKCLIDKPDQICSIEKLAVSKAIDELYKTLIFDVLKTGYLYKRGYLLPTFREYWFVLQPFELSYYKSRSEKNKCGSLSLNTASRVEIVENSHSKFNLSTNYGVFELAASDLMSRHQWISTLKLAIDYSGNSAGYQRELVEKRRQQRFAKESNEKIKEKQLFDERAARTAAEAKCGQLESFAKDEAKRISELEEIKNQLQRLLEEEIQAKKDEETVRTLQARILAEEWEKREELEKIQKEQKLLLQLERTKRKELEERQKDAENKLKNLEEERKKIEKQLKSAHNRIEYSEESRALLEAKLKGTIRAGDRIRRAQSFMPSTLTKPITIDIRPQTLRKGKN